MMNPRRNALSRIARGALVAACIAAPLAALAQDYPARPIKVIVTSSPGSTGDTTMRILGPSLEKLLGQPVVVENIPGSGGVAGTENINFSWFHEDLFTNLHERAANAIPGRPVPLAMVFAMSEGLILPSIDGTGLAFLNLDLDAKAPTFVGDTIYVHCEVVEARLTSKGDRGLVRTQNTVKNARGETVLVYRPQRLMKLRASPASS